MDEKPKKYGYVTVFTNEITKDGNTIEVKNYRVERGYKDKEGNWKNTNSFNRTELTRLYFQIQDVLSQELRYNSNEE